MSLKDKNSNLNLNNTNKYYQNDQVDSLRTRFSRTNSLFTNLNFSKYDPTSTRSIGNSRNIVPTSSPAPETSPNFGDFDNAFSNAFS